MKARWSGWGRSTVPRPSMLVTRAFPTAETGVTHERTGLPSISTVQAPHCARPQPNLGPFSSRSFRRMYRSGVLASTATVLVLPLIRRSKLAMIAPPLLASALPDVARRRSPLSGRGHPAVDGKGGAGDERRLVGEEEERGAGDLLGPAGPAEGHRAVGALAHQLLPVQPRGGLLIGARHENTQHRRVDRPGPDGVHPDLLGREPQRQALDEADHAELAHRVDRAKPGAHESRSRGG